MSQCMWHKMQYGHIIINYKSKCIWKYHGKYDNTVPDLARAVWGKTQTLDGNQLPKWIPTRNVSEIEPHPHSHHDLAIAVTNSGKTPMNHQ